MTPFAVAGAIGALFQLGLEAHAVPVGVAGARLLLVEVLIAIDAGLAATRAVRLLAMQLPSDPAEASDG